MEDLRAKSAKSTHPDFDRVIALLKPAAGDYAIQINDDAATHDLVGGLMTQVCYSYTCIL